MVLEARLTLKIVLSAFIFISSGCTANEKNITDYAEVNGYVLTLSTTNSLCLLESETGEITTATPLKVKPPCYFLRQENQKLLSFPYEDVGISSTIMVIGSQISAEKRKKWAIDQDAVCGESRQGILFRESGIEVSEKTLDGGVVCKDKGADEKDFWYFAH